MVQQPAWKRSRRTALLSLLASLVFVRKIESQTTPEQPLPEDRKPKLPEPNEDPRLPNGKSQKNAIAKDEHDQALRDADHLVSVAQELRDELQRAGTFVVPVTSVKKTEEIEKLAKRIRSRLKS